MNAAEYEKHKKEIDEQAKNLAREVRKIHAGTDEGTLQRKAEEQKRREQRRLAEQAAETLEKVINCKTEPCKPNPDPNGNFCDGCPYHIANAKELENALKMAIEALKEKAEGERDKADWEHWRDRGY